MIAPCLASRASPLADPLVVAALGLSVQEDGAVGVRINGLYRIAQVRRRVHVPIIVIEKIRHPDSDV